MTWEWSHTTEAYEYTREQLGKLKRAELLEIAETWKDKLESDIRPDDLSDDALADWIWEQASSYEHGRSCSNGGHEMYLDPEGNHIVDLRHMPKDWQPEEY